MKNLQVFFLCLLSGIVSFGQENQLFCGERDARVRFFGANPETWDAARMANQQLEQETAGFSEDERGGGQTIYTIPVVFHVIHNNGPENIEDDQILNGLAILNRDFRMLNADISLVVSAFEGVTADIGIEFALATKDPNGNCTKGINRIVSPLTNDGGQSMKDLIQWPRNKYLNVWICADASGAAGYTLMPGDVSGIWGAAADGIVVRSDYVGAIGTSTGSKSRTLTHEVGHWLNLYHTWGPGNSPGVSSNCNQDDQVTDTPNTIGWTSCSLTGSSCGNAVDNVQNYMEYSYCSRMFTQGQRTRMRAALLSNVAQRSSLITAANLLATGVTNPALCVADFRYDKNIICVGDSISFTDASYHAITDWSWNFGDGQTLVGNDPLIHQNPVHTYNTPGTYSVTLTVSNTTGSLSKTYTDVIHVLNSGALLTPIIEGFEGTWPANNWFINNADADETWEVVSTAYSGIKGLKLRNYNSESGHIDEMVSNTYDMSAMDTIFVSYKWSYANRTTTTDDRLRISSSGDCGTSWTLNRIRKGTTTLPTATATNAAFTPTSVDQWNGETLTLTSSSFMTNHYQLKFEFICYGGNNVYLDDINISGVDTLGNFIELHESPVGINLYPNPTNRSSILEIATDSHRKTQVRLYNAAGQIIQQNFTGYLTVGTHQIEITPPSSGFYFVEIVSGNQCIRKKLIVQ